MEKRYEIWYVETEDGRMILKWILEKWDGAWAGSIWLNVGTGGGLL